MVSAGDMTPIPHNIETIRRPKALPVTVVNLKKWIRRGNVDADDALYSMAIRAATDAFEGVTMRRIVSQRVVWRPIRFGDQDLSKYRGHEMAIPLGATAKDTLTINYVDSDGVTTAFTDFAVVTANEKSNSKIVLNSGSEWPTDIDCDTVYPIEIEFDCGWPTGPEWDGGESGTNYAIDSIVIPTYLKQTGTAYVVTVPGLSGTSEPDWPTTTGTTVTDGAVTWECLGATVPSDIKSAILSGAYERCISSGRVLRGDPNMNLMLSNWENIVENWRLWE